MGVFHEGEIAVQTRAGVRSQSERVANGIHTEIPEAAQEFLDQQPFVILGAADSQTGRLWATALFGNPGFAHAIDEKTVYLSSTLAADDPLAATLTGATSAPIGMLAIELATRRRMRLNGNAESVKEGGFLLHAHQVYANCPRYIQRRSFVESTPQENKTGATKAHQNALTDLQVARIIQADTFFIATEHPEGGADASHRGGNPGFVQVESDRRTILFPDYSGNTMFNTLGNIAATGKAGLLFLDWESGDMRHLSGDARILWDDARIASFPGAERLVEVTVHDVVERSGASPLRTTEQVQYSRFNPST